MEQAAGIVAEISEETLLKEEVNCGGLLFKDLCIKLNQIEKLKKYDEKMSKIFDINLKVIINNQSIFPLLRLLIPLNDTTRKKYGLKQATVSTTYVDALQLNPKSADAQRLKFWKNPSKLSNEIAKKTSGEFGEVLQDVLEKRVSVKHCVHTIGEVNNILDELASKSGSDQTTLIRDKILNKFSAVEQKWLMRIVFQDMKIGLKYENVLKWLNPLSLQRYNECTDLRQLCYELARGCLTSQVANGDGVALSKGITLFTCFQPMLAKGFTSSGQIIEVEKAMLKHPFVMDIKLDGERMLCHISKTNGASKGMFWSRNGTDYSTTYRSLLDDIIENVQCDACILDGEVCAWDESTQRFVPFGHNRTVARYEEDARREDPQSEISSSGLHLVYILFDILYLEGLRDHSGRVLLRHQWWETINPEKTIPGGLLALQSEDAKEACRVAHTKNNTSSSAGDILYLPLLARRALLLQAVQLVPSRIQAIRHVAVYTSNAVERRKQIESFFNQVSEEGEEGLVVKDLLSQYSLGIKSRQMMNWVKMKPEYSDMTRDLDLIILGAFYGEGKSMRGQGLSTFLLGVLDPTTSKYKTICKVGTGYSFADLQDLRTKLGPFAQPWDKANKQNLPPHFCPWQIGKNEDVPDVWIPPENSIVVELKCAELVTTTQFSAGITCRFPRVRKIRYDKDFNEIMTVEDIKDVLSRPRMNVEEAATRGVTGAKYKKKRAATSKSDGSRDGGLFRHTGQLVMPQFLVPNSVCTGHQKLDSTIFQGKVFCIIEGSFTLHYFASAIVGANKCWQLKQYKMIDSKQYKLNRVQVIEVVQRNGGEVVANPIPNCFVVVGDTRTFQTKNLIDSGKNDVLNFQYIVDAVNNCLDNEDGNPTPTHFLGFTEETRGIFSGMYDEFGDSFTNAIDESQLRTIFSHMDDTIKSLQRKRDSSRSVSVNSKSNKKAKTNSEEKSSARCLDATISLAQDLEKKDWRQIIRSSDVLEDSDFADILDNCSWNIFWRNNSLIYLDIFDDLGSLERDRVDDIMGKVRMGEKDRDGRSEGVHSLFRSKNIPNNLMFSPNSTRLRSLLPELLLRGAQVSSSLNVEVTHVVVDFENNYSVEKELALQNRLSELRLHGKSFHEKRIVNKRWVEDCIVEGRIVPPTEEHLVKWITRRGKDS